MRGDSEANWYPVEHKKGSRDFARATTPRTLPMPVCRTGLALHFSNYRPAFRQCQGTNRDLPVQAQQHPPNNHQRHTNKPKIDGWSPSIFGAVVIAQTAHVGSAAVPRPLFQPAKSRRRRRFRTPYPEPYPPASRAKRTLCAPPPP